MEPRLLRNPSTSGVAGGVARPFRPNRNVPFGPERTCHRRAGKGVGRKRFVVATTSRANSTRIGELPLAQDLRVDDLGGTLGDDVEAGKIGGFESAAGVVAGDRVCDGD